VRPGQLAGRGVLFFWKVRTTNWTALGPLTNDGSGQYQFNDLPITNGGQRFYRVSSP